MNSLNLLMKFRDFRNFAIKIYEISQKKQNLRIGRGRNREGRSEASKIRGENNVEEVILSV